MPKINSDDQAVQLEAIQAEKAMTETRVLGISGTVVAFMVLTSLTYCTTRPNDPGVEQTKQAVIKASHDEVMMCLQQRGRQRQVPDDSSTQQVMVCELPQR